MSKRIVDLDLIALVKTLPCVACGYVSNETHAHHVKSKGSGGDDVAENLIPLCFQHHRLIHDKGMVWMSAQFVGVDAWLKAAGWSYSAITGWGRY